MTMGASQFPSMWCVPSPGKFLKRGLKNHMTVWTEIDKLPPKIDY